MGRYIDDNQSKSSFNTSSDFNTGDMKDKIDPYLQPLYDALQDMIPAAKLKEYMELNIIQIAPLAFMRGRTLNDAVVILDEAQNTTTQQIKMFLTRMGMNTKMIVTGDMTQIDLPSSQTSGGGTCGKAETPTDTDGRPKLQKAHRRYSPNGLP